MGTAHTLAGIGYHAFILAIVWCLIVIIFRVRMYRVARRENHPMAVTRWYLRLLRRLAVTALLVALWLLCDCILYPETFGVADWVVLVVAGMVAVLLTVFYPWLRRKAYEEEERNLSD
jgi:hypothetical protein